MKPERCTKNRPICDLIRKVFPLILMTPFLFACDSDKDSDYGKKLPDAEPINLRLAEKVETDNSFALDLFRTTYNSDDKENVFVSPLSVSMALSMTLNGAKGATLEKMMYALRANKYSLDDINEYNKDLKEALINVDKSTSLTIANSIWYRNDVSVKNDFISVNKNHYNAEIKALDFGSPDAVKQINNWCAKQTNDKIQEIVEKIPKEALMYLINAVYFKGIWVSKFDKNKTTKEDFYTENNISTGKVNMMHQTGSFDYYSDEYCRYLKLPYGNNAFSMIVMLPNDNKTADDIVSNLDNERWNNAMDYMSGKDVNLSFPRFKTECEYKMQESILPEMGMITPFSPYSADFSGMFENTNACISNVIHKTFVEVNEEGTEAAAVTSVEMIFTSVQGPVIIDYTINKPFVFAIRENSTGVILFIGKISQIKE
ncbi:MAG: serpin family protein [Tannerella sp.]|jgi:serpin B|nr:serpin family protein [Tannerella sp.]